MYARKVTFRLRPNTQPDYTHAFENQILPLLRKQKGFKEAVCLCNPGSVDAVSLSFWEHKRDADEYNTNSYPEVLKMLAKTVDGTPRVHSFETVISTYHNVPATVSLKHCGSEGRPTGRPSSFDYRTRPLKLPARKPRRGVGLDAPDGAMRCLTAVR